MRASQRCAVAEGTLRQTSLTRQLEFNEQTRAMLVIAPLLSTGPIIRATFSSPKFNFALCL